MNHLLIKVFAGLLMAMSVAYADTPRRHFPRGCEIKDFVFYQGYLVLNRNGKQTFYLIHNHTDQELELKHSQLELLFPSLSIKLAPDRWAAFATDIQDLQFQCNITKENETQAFECGDVLEVCQYPRVKFAQSNQGNYWVGINESKEQIITEATQQGIYLRW